MDRLEELLGFLEPTKVYRARCVYEKDKDVFKNVCIKKFGMQLYHEHDCIMFSMLKDTATHYEER